MAWNILLSAAAGLASLAGIGIAYHDPEFDFQLAAPTTESDAILATYQKSPSVSVRFDDAKVGDVLRWLEKQGVSFVVADPKLRDHRITLNVQNQPLDTTADAIAKSLGGHWDRQGAIRIFRNGSTWPGMESFGFQSIPKVGMDGLLMPKSGSGDMKIFEYGPGKNGTNKFELMPPPKPGQNDVRVFELPQNGSAKTWTLPDGKGFKTFEFNNDTLAPWTSNSRTYMFSGEVPTDETKLKELEEKLTKQLEKLYEQRKNAKPEASPFKEGFNFFTAPGHSDFDGFVKSLTEKQKDLMKSQGYLKVDDLTREQKDMLGIKGDGGQMELHYHKDGGATIIVKSSK